MINSGRKLSNDELKRLPDECFPYGTGSEVIINKALLKDICNELVAKRENQEKLIKLLNEADEYSEKLEWKLLIKDLPEIMKKVNKYIENEAL